MIELNNDAFPVEVQNFINRLNFFESGSRYSNELYDFEYVPIVLKIKYLCSLPNYKDIIVPFLKSTAFPIINNSYENFDAFCMGISFKAERLNSEEKDPSIAEYYRLENSKHNLHYKDYDKFILLVEEELSDCRDRLYNEFQYYFKHLEPIVEEYCTLVSVEKNVAKSNKIQTNLSYDELAMLFKILYDFDKEDKGLKKILKDVKYKRDLHKAVVDYITSKEVDEIDLKTYETRYNTINQLDAVEFWVKKFRKLIVAAGLLNDQLLVSKDKTAKKKSK